MPRTNLASTDRRSSDRDKYLKYDVYEEKRRLDEVIAYWKTEAPTNEKKPKGADEIAQTIDENERRPEDKNCIAVCIRGPDDLPLIAMNDWNGAKLKGLYEPGEYEQVPNTTPQLHAEMKILDFNLESVSPHYIGISKPCCLRCAVVMKIVGMEKKHRGCSGGLWKAGWTLPVIVRDHPARLKKFMGAKQYDWYIKLSKPNRDLFFSKMQTAEA